jgi:hypothetical protein
MVSGEQVSGESKRMIYRFALTMERKTINQALPLTIRHSPLTVSTEVIHAS